ncbi:hypothetical protein [Saccharopolyspora hordei]|uniref:Uncharacterized protein n=1 Tax=Saccharopolyspora hordei TaxID=1838 RepID=A0A853ASC1_9PSEU|nr:hypothetical protein [Saccharopolyspora hordei]NYI84940.1 hypothetical protein [Saccharopolyspora hordei]
MATVWVALAAEAVVLLTVAGSLVKWVSRPQSGTPDQAVDQVGPMTERIA